MAIKIASDYKDVMEAIHDIAHNSPLSLDAQARVLNVNPSTYYRYVNKYDDECNFPEKLKEPFMALHDNVEPCRREANNLGYMLVKMPRGCLPKGDMNRNLSQYQIKFNEMMVHLGRFFDRAEPDSRDIIALLDRINRHIEDSAGMRERVRRDKRQTNLFGDE